MPKVTFYSLTSDSEQAALALVCRLAAHACQQQQTAVIVVETAVQLTTLDQLLWQQPVESFTPHASLSNSPSQQGSGQLTDTEPVRIWLTAEPADAAMPWDHYINLRPAAPANVDQTGHLHELVLQHPRWLEPKRQQYKFYRDRGYPLQSRKIG